jgi:hypothetical protein
MTASIGWGFDCPGSEVQHLISAGVKPTAIWPYITGTDGVPWTPEEIDRFRQQGTEVILVNQGFGQGPAAALDGDEFDVEAGAWTLSGLRMVVAKRRDVHWSTRVYCTWSNYSVIKEALAQDGTGRSVFFRIADWNLDQHMAELELHADVYAGQWASPTTNPATLIPGTSLTLAEAGADLSVILHTSTGWQG